MKNLLHQISQCNICAPHLPMGCRPVVQFSAQSTIVIIGQAPGKKVHDSGIPWNDRSGATLRSWLNVNVDQFYNPQIFSIMPMGFCYPGKGVSGDLPPRRECAPLWHPQLMSMFESKPLVLLIGQYAQRHYLKMAATDNLTATVRNFANYLPDYFPLPHPSPRNQHWVQSNPWFMDETIPMLRKEIAQAIHATKTSLVQPMQQETNCNV